MNCNFIISILDFQSDDTSRLSKEVLTVSLDENPNFRQHDYDGNNQLDGIELIQGKISNQQRNIDQFKFSNDTLRKNGHRR